MDSHRALRPVLFYSIVQETVAPKVAHEARLPADGSSAKGTNDLNWMMAACNAMRSCARSAGLFLLCHISRKRGALAALHLDTAWPTIDGCTTATTPPAGWRCHHGVPAWEIFSQRRATSSRYGDKIWGSRALAREPEFPLIGARAGNSAARLHPAIMREPCDLAMPRGSSRFGSGSSQACERTGNPVRNVSERIPSPAARRLKMHHPER
jgi:hypothetical protein